MKIDEVRAMSEEEIHERINDMEKELMNLRLGNGIGMTENPIQIRFKRRDVARLRTVLRERELNIRN